MALIKSISGIRGTIGGKEDTGLTPIDIVKYASSFAFMLKEEHGEGSIVIGRDARLSGEMVKQIVMGVVRGVGLNIIDLDFSTTPTVEMAVTHFNAIGGIILTASHNPRQWNALKLLNNKGEFISAEEGQQVLELANSGEIDFAVVDKLGTYIKNDDFLDVHLEHIKNLELVDVNAIKNANFKIVVDGVNSTGGIAVPKLLKALGVENIVELYCEPTGEFPHNPEPLPENLSAISTEVLKQEADLGIVVDPDVDRLALVSENGEMFGEEYTLVAVADYILQHNKGATVSNLSSSRALRDVTQNAGCDYYASAVGEVNVVTKMKEVDAVIGGEGNGGIIYPASHYGRDALVGIALFLSHLAKSNKPASSLRATYPHYHISKNKIPVEGLDIDTILEKVIEKYKKEEINTVDGLKIDFEEGWVLIRKSNTEPIVRIYSESTSETAANHMANKLIDDIREFAKGNL